MLNLLERPVVLVHIDLHDPIQFGEVEMAIRGHRLLGDKMDSLAIKCRGELTELQMELDQLLDELSQSLK